MTSVRLMTSLLTTVALGLTLTACTQTATSAPDTKNAAPATIPGSFENGRQALTTRINARKEPRKAKNVILFIGDGMGVSTVTAMRIHAGQKQGGAGEDYVLNMERFPHLALSKTYNTDQQVSDSAGTATALMSGEKTRAGVLNIASSIKRGDCKTSLDNQLPTLFEQAAEKGLATGIVSTARITHATPAATYAKSPSRDWERLKDLPEDAVAAGCQSIAVQMEASIKSGMLDVVLGGGTREFEDSFKQNISGTYISTATELNAQGKTGALPLVGLFSKSHMTYMAEKEADNTEPTLTEMTQIAIDRLKNSDEGRAGGYILMIESGRIDHGHHAGKAELALEEGIEFDKAVKTAVDMVDPDNTLIIVTADHSHVFTIAGYPTRGNPILGTVIGNDDHGEPKSTPVLAADGEPYTTLGYQNGPGAVDGVRNPDLSSGKIIRQMAAIPGRSETHAGEDVPVFAKGPSSDLVSGVMEQNTIYHVMRHALDF